MKKLIFFGTIILFLLIFSCMASENLYSKQNDLSFNLEKGENGKAPTTLLNSGYEMPVLGIGTFQLHGDTCYNSVLSALQNGYRLIDTAYIYGNEDRVGKAIKDSGVPREEIFITTKLYMNQYKNAEKSINDALKKLGVEYIDLMLLHHPGENDVEAYKSMEKAVREGKIRSLGLSNFYIDDIEKFLKQITIMPALIQNEIHPYFQEKDDVKYMKDKGIVAEAWYPLGGRANRIKLFEDKIISDIAKTHNKSSAQIILRWHLQRGVVAIPGSSNPTHIKENISIFDFELSEEEMKAIEKLDKNQKHSSFGRRN